MCKDMFTKCVLILGAAVAASAFSMSDGDVVFHLYNVASPQVSEPLLPSANSIMKSSFDLSLNTVITIHSFGENVTGNFNAFVIPAHLSVEPLNVIAVDWSPGCSMYTLGLGNAPQAGEVIASFVNILVTDFSYSGQIRLVGVGLGAHVAGIAARQVNTVVGHIVALDPSLHGWPHHPDRLSKDDAEVVEVIHTTSGVLGYDLPLGHLDFYANDGVSQVNCLTDSNCSYQYSYIFYAESVTRDINGGNQFLGTQCDSYEQALEQKCSGSSDAHFGGTDDKNGLTGIYNFATNNAPPFAKG